MSAATSIPQKFATRLAAAQKEADVLKKAAQDAKKGRHPSSKVSRQRSLATTRALKREGHKAASKESLSRQVRTAAKRRSPAERSASARKAARTRAARKR